MIAHSLNDIKKELQDLPPKQLAELCISLAKYKKDNKEFLDYLLFKSHDKTEFINEIKEDTDLLFQEIDPKANLYYTKKSLRKILRLITKYTKYIGDKTATIELLIYFCYKLKSSGIPFHKNQLIVNMYDQQLKKTEKLIAGLHNDLQLDYINELEKLQ